MRAVKLHIETLDRFIGETMAMAERLDRGDREQQAQALGRDYRGVHADVTVLVDAGLIQRDDSGAISVPWSRVSAEMALDVAPAG